MSWLSAAPLLLVTAAWVLLPGAAITHAAGLRGIAAWGAAPAASVATLATTAVVAGRLGAGWGPGPAAVAAVVVTVVAALVRLVVRRVSGRRAGPEPDGWRPAAAAAAGTVLAAALATATTVLGTGRADALSHTYDAVFHYNAVARILTTGDGSSLTLGLLTDPATTAAFYPAAWHDLVALAALSVPGTPIPAASNAAALVVAGLVWPLGCLLLVRQVVGPSVPAALLTPVLAAGFVAFPWSLMQFGVLWPNLLGLALLPVGLAALVALLGLGERALRPAQAATVGALAAVALALAHPSALFSLAVTAAAPVLWALVRPGLRWPARLLLLVVAGGVAAGVLYVVVLSPALAEMRTFDWPAYQTPPQAIGEVLLGATNRRPAAWALSLAVVVGLVAAARRGRTSWLVAAHAAAALMFLLASALDTPLAATATAVWYNDSFRLAAMVPVTGVPLAVLGLLAAGRAVAGRLPAVPVLRRPGIAATALAVLVALASSGLYAREHAETLALTYDPPDGAYLVTAPERAFLGELRTLLPPDAVVAQNPWNGSPLLTTLADRAVLFPHMQGRWTPDHLVVAQRLDEVATDPAVCAAVRRLGVTHVLVGGTPFWPWDARVHDYPGIDAVDGGPTPLVGSAPAPGFTPVASADGAVYRLYRITACAASGDAA